MLLLRRLFHFCLLPLLLVAADAQTTDPVPVEITSTGGTTYKDGIATAHEDVAIRYGDTDIFADAAEYNSITREINLSGNVRIYRGVNLFVGDSASYNLVTGQVKALNLRTEFPPYFLAAADVETPTTEQYVVKEGVFTTHDSSRPDFRLRARKVRIYGNNRAVFQDVTLLIGDVPVFWWPYLYQSLDDTFSVSVSPAYLSSWGPSLLSQVTFPLTDRVKARLRLDYRTRRGPAIGFEAETRYGKENSSFADLKTYLLSDQNPLLNRTSEPRGSVGTARYRVSFQSRHYFTEDIYTTIDVTKLSDEFLLQDFFQTEFRYDPQPDNIVAATKKSPYYTLTLLSRFQANAFFETTERFPELVLDVKRHGLFGGPIYYEGETGIAELRRNFARGSGLEDYGTTRADTFHQFLYPNTYLGWLSIVPRVGVRGTYYSESRDLKDSVFFINPDPLIPDFVLPPPTLANPLEKGGDKFRTVFNAGVEASFKLSRTWEDAQNRAIGLDGLRHIIQPFTNFSYVSDAGSNTAEILQFDRYQPTTQLRPIDFPQFTSVDSIDRWNVWRVGVRNRLQTRRDDLTISWLEVETFLDVNIDNPFDDTDYSNFFNRLRFAPVPWATLAVSSQVPAFDEGFTEVNTSITFQPIPSLLLGVGHRYLSENPFFRNSSLFTLNGYLRLNDHWGIGVHQQYEGTSGILEHQRYSIHRDLTSWVASLGAVIRDNAGVNEYGILLTFTLKAFPKFGFDFNFDPTGEGTEEP